VTILKPGIILQSPCQTKKVLSSVKINNKNQSHHQHHCWLPLRTSSSYFSSASSSSFSKDDDEDDDEEDNVDTATTVLQDEIAHANQRYAQRVVVREDRATAGWGVFATADCAAGSLVLEGRTRHPNSVTADAHSIQTSPYHHVRMDLPARFLNHACGSGANVGVRLPSSSTATAAKKQQFTNDNNNDNDWTTVYEFVAKRDIARGEQLRFDYETTEWALQSPFDCACGSAQCRGTVAGFGVTAAAARQNQPQQRQPQSHHDDDDDDDDGHQWIAPHLLEMLEAAGQQDKTGVGNKKKK